MYYKYTILDIKFAVLNYSVELKLLKEKTKGGHIMV